jgi:hypothetical protein
MRPGPQRKRSVRTAVPSGELANSRLLLYILAAVITLAVTLKFTLVVTSGDFQLELRVEGIVEAKRGGTSDSLTNSSRSYALPSSAKGAAKR